MLVLLLASGCAPSPAEPAADRRADALLDDAVAAARHDRFDEAIRALDRALALEPGLRRARMLKAAVRYQQAGRQPGANGAAAGDLLREAEALVRGPDGAVRPRGPDERELCVQVLYEAARAHASSGRPRDAVAALEAAVAAGLDPPGALDRDDFRALRDRDDFRALRDRAAREAGRRARDRARELLATSEPFRFRATLPDLDGNPVDLADLLGRVTIVDLWGTWCPPCRQELPHFAALHAKYRARGLAVVGVAFEDDPPASAREKVRRFVADAEVPYPCLLGDEAALRQVPDFVAFPTTLFLDRTGTVRAKLVGYAPQAQLEAIVAELLAEPADRAGGGAS